MIFYFSATGNSRWAANKLSQLLHDTNIISIPAALKGDCRFRVSEDEPIGFIFPVHGWRPPKIVRDFIERLQIISEEKPFHYTYSVITAGDDIGMTVNYLQKDISRKGLQLDSAFSLIMPESYVGLPFMDVDTKETANRKKREALKQLVAAAESISSHQNVFHVKRGRCPRLKSHVIGWFFVKQLITDKRFWVDKDKCVKCGICANVCPVDDIQGGHGKMPAWLHNQACLTCFNCYHHCPHHAIEFGRFTKNKGQYYFT